MAILCLFAVLAGCSSSEYPMQAERGGVTGKKAVAEAPGKKSSRKKDWRPEVYVVQKGDTLYGIAFNYGLDYHELAEINGIQDPSVISIGQEIRLFPGKPKAAASADIKPDGTPASEKLAPEKIIPEKIKDQPKLVKYAYSPAAMAQIDKVQEIAKPGVAAVTVENLPPKPETRPDAQADAAADDAPDDGDSEEAALDWNMPAQGKVIARFSESANRKGVDIAGKLGQPVFASAAGKVVYSGSGLRGYGKLIIIKHNKTYLSAYAHNDKVLVKEGQAITRGQKIAEMGSTDADQVKLHFEVRRFGKPVDPAKYLPLGKS